MSLIDRIIVGQTFQSRSKRGRGACKTTWIITSTPMRATTGDLFVWCEAKARVGYWSPSGPVPWHIKDIPGQLGEDVRDYYKHMKIDIGNAT